MHFRRFRTCSHVADRGYTCHEFSLASGDFGPRTGSVVVLNTSRSMIAIHQSLVCGLAHVFCETETPLSFLSSRSAGTLTETDGKTSRSTGTAFWWFASILRPLSFRSFLCNDWRIHSRPHVTSVAGSHGFRSRRLISLWQDIAIISMNIVIAKETRYLSTMNSLMMILSNR